MHIQEDSNHDWISNYFHSVSSHLFLPSSLHKYCDAIGLLISRKQSPMTSLLHYLTFSFEISSPCTKINSCTWIYNAAASPASHLNSLGWLIGNNPSNIIFCSCTIGLNACYRILGNIWEYFPIFKTAGVAKKIWRIVNTVASIWGENMLRYLSLDIIIPQS